ncbi:AEC family transporter [Rhodoferax sp. BLA1]|uniref:AEC family transporter n=1 Tax=Rhodoferax sp. BLA1 TaxID=2576062 RepID=UPI0015D2FA97|nr:AEC family transporter [Rhodoferax sp. BLA1]
MTSILSITGPIYLAIALGYVCTRFGWFSRADMRVFGQFVIRLALPGLLFSTVATREITDILNVSYLLAYLVGTLFVITLGLAWGKRQHLPSTDNVMAAMGMSCSNSSFIGYPILLLTLAPVAAVALALNMMVENLVVIPLLLVLAERGRHQGGNGWQMLQRTAWQLVKNPLIVALALGLTVALMRWQLPEPLSRSINLFATASAGLSLFVIGGTLFGLPLKGMGRQIAPIVVAKLLLHPLAVALATLALPLIGLPALAPHLQLAAVMLAAMPMMSIYPVLAQSYGKENLGAAALLATTVISFFTLSGLLWLTH